ncbi:gp82 [Mycobacterium phage Corndog]|uniref:Uncharacterized protein n=1 Tax=Mycobacterium phage Corndog TaxID=205875 RepID=Q856L2_BPMCO|nr:gp82 [Mycobacterium phage Corndog]AAN02014.1 hypothetical protein PBI_CORNDOG_82 [Mycobacterium phage Corndog]
MDGHMKAQLETLEQIFTTEEELHPDLQPWLKDDGPFGTCLKHPLVYSIVHTPQMNALVNRQYTQKTEELRKARDEGKWQYYVWLHERPWRAEAFGHISWRLDGPEYWELLGRVWSDTENAWQYRSEWRDYLSADPEGREMMSTPEVRCVFTRPPETGGLLPMTRVYRGYCHDDGADGFSWTLDKARARWFATRLRESGDPPGRIIAGFVAKEHVIAYITSRDEQEIVCFPEHVVDKEVEDA